MPTQTGLLMQLTRRFECITILEYLQRCLEFSEEQFFVKMEKNLIH